MPRRRGRGGGGGWQNGPPLPPRRTGHAAELAPGHVAEASEALAAVRAAHGMPHLAEHDPWTVHSLEQAKGTGYGKLNRSEVSAQKKLLRRDAGAGGAPNSFNPPPFEGWDADELAASSREASIVGAASPAHASPVRGMFGARDTGGQPGPETTSGASAGAGAVGAAVAAGDDGTKLPAIPRVGSASSLSSDGGAEPAAFDGPRTAAITPSAAELRAAGRYTSAGGTHAPLTSAGVPESAERRAYRDKPSTAGMPGRLVPPSSIVIPARDGTAWVRRDRNDGGSATSIRQAGKATPTFASALARQVAAHHAGLLASIQSPVAGSKSVDGATRAARSNRSARSSVEKVAPDPMPPPKASGAGLKWRTERAVPVPTTAHDKTRSTAAILERSEGASVPPDTLASRVMGAATKHAVDQRLGKAAVDPPRPPPSPIAASLKRAAPTATASSRPVTHGMLTSATDRRRQRMAAAAAKRGEPTTETSAGRTRLKTALTVKPVVPPPGLPPRFFELGDTKMFLEAGDDGNVRAAYDTASKQFQRVLFPSDTPATREEAVYLGRVLDEMMNEIRSGNFDTDAFTPFDVPPAFDSAELRKVMDMYKQMRLHEQREPLSHAPPGQFSGGIAPQSWQKQDGGTDVGPHLMDGERPKSRPSTSVSQQTHVVTHSAVISLSRGPSRENVRGSSTSGGLDGVSPKHANAAPHSPDGAEVADNRDRRVLSLPLGKFTIGGGPAEPTAGHAAPGGGGSPPPKPAASPQSSPTTSRSQREEAARAESTERKEKEKREDAAVSRLRRILAAMDAPVPIFDANVDASREKDVVGFAPEVKAEISALNVVMYELVRHVYVQCEERGALLERVRKRMMEILGAADVWCEEHARNRFASEARWATIYPLIGECKELERQLTASRAMLWRRQLEHTAKINELRETNQRLKFVASHGETSDWMMDMKDEILFLLEMATGKELFKLGPVKLAAARRVQSQLMWRIVIRMVMERRRYETGDFRDEAMKQYMLDGGHTKASMLQQTQAIFRNAPDGVDLLMPKLRRGESVSSVAGLRVKYRHDSMRQNPDDAMSDLPEEVDFDEALAEAERDAADISERVGATGRLTTEDGDGGSSAKAEQDGGAPADDDAAGDAGEGGGRRKHRKHKRRTGKGKGKGDGHDGTSGRRASVRLSKTIESELAATAVAAAKAREAAGIDSAPDRSDSQGPDSDSGVDDHNTGVAGGDVDRTARRTSAVSASRASKSRTSRDSRSRRSSKAKAKSDSGEASQVSDASEGGDIISDVSDSSDPDEAGLDDDARAARREERALRRAEKLAVKREAKRQAEQEAKLAAKQEAAKRSGPGAAATHGSGSATASSYTSYSSDASSGSQGTVESVGGRRHRHRHHRRRRRHHHRRSRAASQAGAGTASARDSDGRDELSHSSSDSSYDEASNGKGGSRGKSGFKQHTHRTRRRSIRARRRSRSHSRTAPATSSTGARTGGGGSGATSKRADSDAAVETAEIAVQCDLGPEPVKRRRRRKKSVTLGDGSIGVSNVSDAEFPEGSVVSGLSDIGASEDSESDDFTDGGSASMASAASLKEERDSAAELERQMERRRQEAAAKLEEADRKARAASRKSQFKNPVSWKKFLTGFKKTKARPAPPRMCLNTIMSVYIEKIKADQIDIREGTEIDSMPDYVTNHLLFKFGTRQLVQLRLYSLLGGVKKMYKSNRMAKIFARFCGMIDPLPTECLTQFLQALDVALSEQPTAQGKDKLAAAYPDVHLVVRGRRAIDALRSVGADIANSNVGKAESMIRSCPLIEDHVLYDGAASGAGAVVGGRGGGSSSAARKGGSTPSAARRRSRSRARARSRAPSEDEADKGDAERKGAEVASDGKGEAAKAATPSGLASLLKAGQKPDEPDPLEISKTLAAKNPMMQSIYGMAHDEASQAAAGALAGAIGGAKKTVAPKFDPSELDATFVEEGDEDEGDGPGEGKGDDASGTAGGGDAVEDVAPPPEPAAPKRNPFAKMRSVREKLLGKAVSGATSGGGLMIRAETTDAFAAMSSAAKAQQSQRNVELLAALGGADFVSKAKKAGVAAGLGFATKGGSLRQIAKCAADAAVESYVSIAPPPVDKEQYKVTQQSARDAGLNAGLKVGSKADEHGNVDMELVVAAAAGAAANIMDLGGGKREQKAALKLQSIFRGRQARRKIKAMVAPMQEFAKSWINVEDFMQIFVKMWVTAREVGMRKVRKFFLESDENGDGVLEFHEFQELVQLVATDIGATSRTAVVIPESVSKRMYLQALKESGSNAISLEVFGDVVQHFMYRVVLQEMNRMRQAIEDGAAVQAERKNQRRRSTIAETGFASGMKR